MKSAKGFTLIELLMVVAVLGLLSSIVLGPLQEARDRGRVAAGQKFSQSLKGSLGDMLIGEWSLNGTTTENSGNINGCVTDTTNGTLPFVEGMFDQGVNCDGAGGYVRCTNDFGPVSPEGITIEAWVNIPPGTDNGGGNGRAVMSAWSASACQVLLQANSTEVRFWPDVQNAQTVTLSSVNLSGWTHIAVTFDYTSKVGRIYIDGALVHQETEPTLVQNAWSRVLIGRYRTTTGDMRPFVGRIDNVRIYENSLSVGAIQKHYTDEVGLYPKIAKK